MRYVGRLYWFLRQTDSPTKKPKSSAEKFEKQTPRGQQQIVSPERSVAPDGGITQYIYTSKN